MHTAKAVIPHLAVHDGARAIDFYQQAFGFEIESRMPMPDGKIMHCEMKHGDCVIFLADEFPGRSSISSPVSLGGSSVAIHLNCPDADSTYRAAIAAGATSIFPMTDMFWGDRFGQVKDPFGHVWSLATHKEAVTPAEMKRRMEAMFSNQEPAEKA